MSNRNIRFKKKKRGIKGIFEVIIAGNSLKLLRDTKSQVQEA